MNDNVWISLNFNAMSKEDKKRFNERLDQIANELGYALCYANTKHFIQIGTMQDLNQTIDYFAQMDARLNESRAEELEIVPVNDLNVNTKRRLVREKLEDNFNDKYQNGDPKITALIKDKNIL